MNCPFQLSYRYLQPNGENRVSVSEGISTAAREPLLEALRRTDLTLVGSALSAVYADAAKVEVPCGRFELQPKE